jgi:hypothetical protein
MFTRIITEIQRTIFNHKRAVISGERVSATVN